LAIDLPFSAEERQNAILEYISKEKRVSVLALCKEFGISEATARRDLEILEKSGRVKRVWGGAIIDDTSPPELPILIRESEQSIEKIKIGQAVAKLIEPGETVFLGSGSTVLEVARQLQNCQELTVLTNSLPIVNLLIGCKGITMVVFGGELRDSELSFIGHITESALKEVRADKVILGARAISLEYGITSDFLAETLTDRAIIKIGRQVILVADHTKFGSVSTAFLAPLEDINLIVTDHSISKDYLKSLEEKGIELLLA